MIVLFVLIYKSTECFWWSKEQGWPFESMQVPIWFFCGWIQSDAKLHFFPVKMAMFSNLNINERIVTWKKVLIVFICFNFLIKPTISDRDGVFKNAKPHTQNFYELLIFCFGIIELIFSRSWRIKIVVRGRSMILSYRVWVLLHSPYSFMELSLSSTPKVGKKTLLRVKQKSSIFLAGSFF